MTRGSEQPDDDGAPTSGRSRGRFARRKLLGKLGLTGKILSSEVSLTRFIEPTWVEFTELELVVKTLPPQFDGFRIAHITDTHLGAYVSRRFLIRQIDHLNRLGCDVAVFTGDLISNSYRKVSTASEIIGRADAPFGKFAVLGNHDYRVGHGHVERQLSLHGYRVMHNESFRIGIGDEAIHIVGIDDLWSATPNPELATQGIDRRNETVIALMHNPDMFPQLAGKGYDVILAGHTHGGQVVLPWWGPPIVPSAYGQLFASGLVERKGTRMYVSRGVGRLMWMRWNCRSELPIVTLRCPKTGPGGKKS